MSSKRTISPVAHIRTDFPDKFGVPRQSGRAPSLRARIVFEPVYRDKDALRDIEGFTHLWLLFDFSLVDDDACRSLTVRPPRLGGNRRVGVFASRSPYRPNRIGLSSVRLHGVEMTENGPELIVGGADLVDGTPIYDIKPYLPFSDSHPDASSGYAAEGEGHKLFVIFTNNTASLVPEEKRDALVECLSDDPRPSYQDDPERVYAFDFDRLCVSFSVKEDTLSVLNIRTKENTP